MSGIGGAIARVERAQNHIGTLKREIEKFRGGDPYGHRVDVYREKPFEGLAKISVLESIGIDLPGVIVERLDDDTAKVTATWVEEFGIRLDVRNEPDTLRWGVIAGDAIHNLRTALDYIVWELADKASGPPPDDPIPSGSPWRAVGFPVVQQEGDWHSGLQKLSLIDSRLHAKFKRLQPFDGGRKHPERHWLTKLQELWNRDKHRAVTIVNSLIALERVNPGDWDWIEPEKGDAPGRMVAHVLKRRKPGPLEHNAELARIRVLNNMTNRVGLEKAMNMNLVFAYDIAFDQGPPAYGGLVIDTLEDLQNRVTAVVLQFKTEFP